jgi:chromosome segregation ATPase
VQGKSTPKKGSTIAGETGTEEVEMHRQLTAMRAELESAEHELGDIRAERDRLVQEREALHLTLREAQDVHVRETET